MSVTPGSPPVVPRSLYEVVDAGPGIESVGNIEVGVEFVAGPGAGVELLVVGMEDGVGSGVVHAS